MRALEAMRLQGVVAILLIGAVLIGSSGCGNCGTCGGCCNSGGLAALALEGCGEDKDEPSRMNQERERWKTWAGIAGLGAGAILTSVGTAEGAMALKRRGQVYPSLEDRERDLLVGQAENYEYTSAWTLGVGVPLLAAGIVLLAVDAAEKAKQKGDAPKKPSVTVAPSVAGDGAGLVLNARF